MAEIAASLRTTLGEEVPGLGSTSEIDEGSLFTARAPSTTPLLAEAHSAPQRGQDGAFMIDEGAATVFAGAQVLQKQLFSASGRFGIASQAEPANALIPSNLQKTGGSVRACFAPSAKAGANAFRTTRGELRCTLQLFCARVTCFYRQHAAKES